MSATASTPSTSNQRTGDLGSDVGLAGMIGRDHFDVQAGAEVLGGHLGGDDRALAVRHGCRTGDVGQNADLDLAIAEFLSAAGGLRHRWRRQGQTHGRGQIKA
jgi:hypothetical protein